MKLFFLSPWPLSDPLSTATVLPHLRWLVSDSRVSDVFVLSPPGNTANDKHSLTGFSTKLTVITLPAKSSRLPVVSHALHHHKQKRMILALAQEQRPALVICRGTSGIYGDLLQRRLNVPYVVESFEPHAHYMLQTGTWGR